MSKKIKMDIMPYSIYLLSRRDYSEKELRRKYEEKGFTTEESDEVMDRLIECDYQSNDRCIKVLVDSSIRDGRGVQRIYQKANEKGLNRDLINEYIETLVIDWGSIAEDTRVRKYGKDKPDSPKEKNKQMNFLLRRGFSYSDIKI
jgi:regulatory protein